MTSIDLASLTASIASLILAVVAIWLSVFFYRMSSQLSESTKEAAKGIGASVDRLEKLFDKLYADTFSMMKDTVSDMRKHIWPEDTQVDDKALEEAETKADEKINALKGDVQKQLSNVLRSQKLTDKRLTDVTQEINQIMDRLITRSRELEVEAREETIREHIMRAMRTLMDRQAVIRAEDVVKQLSKFPGSTVVEELQRMKREEWLDYRSPIGPETIISLRGIQDQTAKTAGNRR